MPVIILEDVSGKGKRWNIFEAETHWKFLTGFGVIERPPEDFDVSKQIFRRLAKFHASGFYLLDEKVKFPITMECNLRFMFTTEVGCLEFRDESVPECRHGQHDFWPRPGSIHRRCKGVGRLRQVSLPLGVIQKDLFEQGSQNVLAKPQRVRL